MLQQTTGFRVFHKEQLPLFLFVIVLFMMGAVFGSLMVNSLSLDQKQEVMQMLNGFFHVSMAEGSAPTSANLVHYFGAHAKWLALIWLFGLSVIGLPLVLVLDFLKGVLIGFSIGFMTSELSWNGLWFALASIAPQNLLLIPALLIASTAAISYSILVVKHRFIQQKGPIAQPMLQYSFISLLMVALSLAAALVQTYISPVLMKWTAPMVAAWIQLQ